MVKHIVMWKLHDIAEGNGKEQNALKMKELLEGLNGKIEGLRHIELGIDFKKAENSYDVVLYTEFNSREDLENYIVHPEHVKVGKFVRSVVSQRASVDYII